MLNDTNVYDLWSPEARASPHPIYERMRIEDSIHRAIGPLTGNPIWFLTRFKDCTTFLRDPRFVKDFRKHVPSEHTKRHISLDEAFGFTSQHMLNLDPPDHLRLRKLVDKEFAPKVVRKLRPRIQFVADKLLDSLQFQNQIDLIADFAMPLSFTIIAEILGIPTEVHSVGKMWIQVIQEGGQDESKIQKARMAILEFSEFIQKLFTRYRLDRQYDTLIGKFTTIEGEDFRIQEIISMIFLLLISGYETTAGLIGNGIFSLLQHQDQLVKLRKNPELIDRAIEEILRFNSSVEATTNRWALENVEFGNKIIPRGELVRASLLSANRDSDQFLNPHNFDILRTPNAHIAFGNGIHYCLGASLARLESVIAINTLLRRIPKFALKTDLYNNLEWSDLLLHSLKALPIFFD